MSHLPSPNLGFHICSNSWAFSFSRTERAATLPLLHYPIRQLLVHWFPRLPRSPGSLFHARPCTPHAQRCRHLKKPPPPRILHFLSLGLQAGLSLPSTASQLKGRQGFSGLVWQTEHVAMGSQIRSTSAERSHLPLHLHSEFQLLAVCSEAELRLLPHFSITLLRREPSL